MEARRNRWWRRALVALGICAVCGLATTQFLFAEWGEVEAMTQEEAARRFRDGRAASGDERAYVEVDTDEVRVRRELEGEPTDLATLHFLAWQPGEGRLVTVDFPFWFVRLKTNDAVNLGTLTAVSVGDWEHIDLDVSVDDLERRGPGVVLDHTAEDGSRLLLWTSASPE